MTYQRFLDMLSEGHIIDQRYPMRGVYVWPSYGLSFKENVFRHIASIFRREGYEKIELPRLMPGDFLRTITRRVRNFEDGVYWLREQKGGLDVYLNPTGEAAVNFMLSLWVRSGKDLPIRIFQEGNTFRPHSRPLPLVNADQFYNLVEAHSVHATRQACSEELERIKGFMRGLHESLGIPYILVQRPLWGNNPVAESMSSFESYLPFLERSFNVGVVYNQGQIFSRAFGTKFRAGGKTEYTYQNTFGLSERCLGAMLSLHADEYGICMLPEFAPIQVAVAALGGDEALRRAHNIEKSIDGFRVQVNENSGRSPQRRFGDYLKMGVPLRIGVRGDSDIVTVSRRDDLDVREVAYTSNFRQIAEDSVKCTERALKERAEARLARQVVEPGSVTELSEYLSDNFICKINWCSDEECGKLLERSSPGEVLGWDDSEPSGACLGCGNNAEKVAYLSKRAPSP